MSAENHPLWTHPLARPLEITQPGPFVQAENGDLLSACADGKSLARSTDLGKTWTQQPMFEYTAKSKEYKYSGERVLFRTRSGALVFSFMNINEKVWLWRAELGDALPGTRLPHYVTRSTDNGQTWSEPVKLHEEWTGEIRNIIQLKSGRLVLSSMKLLHNPGRHSVLTYGSDDDGVTWKGSNLIDLGGQGHHGGVTEATIEELKDGSVLMLLRTNWQQFWRAISHDGGAHWREIVPSGIDASSAPGLLKRLASGRMLLVWNRLYPEGKSQYATRGGDGQWSEVACSNHREELSIAWYDEATHKVSEPIVVARQVDAWLSYPRVFEVRPGELWLTNMTLSKGDRVALVLNEADFI
jgi:sialidase-1